MNKFNIGRIGDSHLNVISHYGQFGYWEKCFLKELNAYILYAKKLEIELNTIIGGCKTNLRLRKFKEWEK